MSWTVWYKDEDGEVQVRNFCGKASADAFAAHRDDALVMQVVDVEITES
jgi:hypothetical protein